MERSDTSQEPNKMEAMKNAASKLLDFKSEDLALPKGSLILVTGASGFVASHVIKEALEAGYKVRGTTRTDEKAANTRKVFNNHPDYSTAIVVDFAKEGVFDDAMKGVDAVIHVASDTTLGSDPDRVIKPTVQGVLSILHSAANESSVKRFVLTSSSTAVLLPKLGKEVTVSKDDWNLEALEPAYAPPPYTADRSSWVYAASKVEGERALWKFVKEQKPGFVANSILPNFNMGTILPGGSPGPTGNAVPTVYKGGIPQIGPQYMIDVVDDARLHIIAAALDPSINNERIFAFNVPFNWTDVIQIIKKLRPDATSVAKPPQDEGRDLSKVPNELGAQLLKKWYGQDGYKSMEQSVAENLEGQV